MTCVCGRLRCGGPGCGILSFHVAQRLPQQSSGLARTASVASSILLVQCLPSMLTVREIPERKTLMLRKCEGQDSSTLRLVFVVGLVLWLLPAPTPFCTWPPLCAGALWPMPAWVWREVRFLFYYFFFSVCVCVCVFVCACRACIQGVAMVTLCMRVHAVGNSRELVTEQSQQRAHPGFNVLQRSRQMSSQVHILLYLLATSDGILHLLVLVSILHKRVRKFASPQGVATALL